MQAQILAPAAVLVLWSIVMLFWMAGTRLPAMAKGGGLGAAKPGGRGQDLEGVIPDQINWKAHNYAHLMEQPTIFYAIVLALAVMGFDHPINVMLAWGYVVLRIVHSIVQATINVVAIRLSLFALSTLCLAALTFHAAMALWH